jgi:hypothetical protein
MLIGSISSASAQPFGSIPRGYCSDYYEQGTGRARRGGSPLGAAGRLCLTARDPSPLARRWGKVAFVRFVSNCRSMSGSFVHRGIVAGCRCFAGLLTSGPHQEGRHAEERSAVSAKRLNTPAALAVRVVGSVRVALGPDGVGASVTRPGPSRARPVLSTPGPPAGGGPRER